jgi:MFS family permease
MAALFIAAQLILVLRLPISSYVLWAVIASIGAATVLSYAILADCFPPEIAGQANAALNVLHIGGAFILQCSIGLVIDRWATHDGHYPPIAYQTAFAIIVVLQILALTWFVLPDRPKERCSSGDARMPRSQPDARS